MGARPIRVLHAIDGLGGGGSERWIWELVRLSDPTRVVHRVVPIHFDLGRFVYAERLRAAGAMRSTRRAPSRLGGDHLGPSQPADGRLLPRSPLRDCPAAIRRGLVRLWHYGAVFPAAAVRSVDESIRFRPDVIHGHTFHGFVAGLSLSALFRRPLVHSVPSFFKHVIDSGYGWLPGAYARYHRRVDRFLTNYPSELVSIGVAPEKIVVFRGMADVAAIARLDRAVHRLAVRRQLGISD